MLSLSFSFTVIILEQDCFFFFFGQIIAMISEKKCVCWGVGGQAAKGCAASGRFWKGVCIDLSYCYTRPVHGAVLHGHV